MFINSLYIRYRIVLLGIIIFKFFILSNVYAAEVLPSLSGQWIADKRADSKWHIQQSGEGDLTVTRYPDRGPYNGRINNDRISVDFQDVTNCCAGHIVDKGYILHWSNGSIWEKIR